MSSPANLFDRCSCACATKHQGALWLKFVWSRTSSPRRIMRGSALDAESRKLVYLLGARVGILRRGAHRPVCARVSVVGDVPLAGLLNLFGKIVPMVRTVFLGDPADPHSTVETRAACRRWNAGLRHLFKNCPNHCRPRVRAKGRGSLPRARPRPWARSGRSLSERLDTESREWASPTAQVMLEPFMRVY